jgi:3-deoxy-D-manno-octulosonic-acid transferase
MSSILPKSIRWAFRAYDQAWRPILPGLHRHVKLRDGFAQRLRVEPEPSRGPVDVWIQAASAGEAHLAAMLAANLRQDARLQILATTNTRQGMDILEATAVRMNPATHESGLRTLYFPFDRPAIMQQAVTRLNPRVMVLLETELWPGLLFALRQAGIPVVLVNARLQARSLRAYRLWPQVWQLLAPQRILAVSRNDAVRLKRLFGSEPVARMPNMKFDRIARPAKNTANAQSLDWIPRLPPGVPLVVMGSIHREEEIAVTKVINYLHRHGPEMVIGVYPRHMHRIEPWERRLCAAGLRCCRRSGIDSPLKGGTVVIGDVFGELATTYSFATAAFVGGSLAPLGGHNFLEPLLGGITPVIGPHWHSFEWVGTEIFQEGLVHIASGWQTAAQLLLKTIMRTVPKKTIQHRADTFCERHRGGTDQACRVIREFLGASPEHLPS